MNRPSLIPSWVTEEMMTIHTYRSITEIRRLELKALLHEDEDEDLEEVA
jgi:hypothetical protein